MSLLKHYGIHFSQLHPLAFLWIIHFELSCSAFTGEPSVPLFWRCYCLRSYSDWFTFEKRKDSISLPCYSFMTTSTYPKQWKTDLSLCTVETHVRGFYSCFQFSYGHPAMGGLSPFYPTCPRDFFDGREMSLWSLLQADVGVCLMWLRVL
ncbi:hypothetical protein Hanom_Chr06g00558731 [Helianthus anomalus]